MRIHRLEISAFGPFAGTEDIDFDRLSAHGLFLLNGPTGAGKTSVLDAICFALYGSVPGARQDGKRLRSDHAEAAAEPRVTCEFSAQGRHFEVSRSPAWDKPSARGKNGFTVAAGQHAAAGTRRRRSGWRSPAATTKPAPRSPPFWAWTGSSSPGWSCCRRATSRPSCAPRPQTAWNCCRSLFGTQRFEAVEQELAGKAQAAADRGRQPQQQAGTAAGPGRGRDRGAGARHRPGPRTGTDADALLAWLGGSAGSAAKERQAAAAEAERLQGRDMRRDWTPRRRAPPARPSLPPRERRRSDAEAAAPGACREDRQAGPAPQGRSARRPAAGGGQRRGGRGTGSRGHGRGRRGTAGGGPHATPNSPASTGPDAGPGPPRPDAGPRRRGAPSTAQPCGASSAGCAPCRRCWRNGCRTRTRLAGLIGAHAPSCARRWSSCTTAQPFRRCGPGRPAHRNGRAARRSPSARGTCRPRSSCAPRRPRRPRSWWPWSGAMRAAEAACAGVAERHRVARDEHQDRRQRWLDLREERLANAAAELAAQLLPASPARSAAVRTIRRPPRPRRPHWPSPRRRRPPRTPARPRRRRWPRSNANLPMPSRKLAVLAARAADTAPGGGPP